MTNEEAINLIADMDSDKYTAREAVALTMAIKALEAFEIPPNDNWDGYSSRLWKSAYERGKADAEQRWIPVSERLPKIGERVMVTYQCKFDEEAVEITIYDKYGFCIQPVVAWMPLPEPYSESEDKYGKI